MAAVATTLHVASQLPWYRVFYRCIHVDFDRSTIVVTSRFSRCAGGHRAEFDLLEDSNSYICTFEKFTRHMPICMQQVGAFLRYTYT